MIYLDNAATTWPKPASVRAAVANAMIAFGANPGRGGHRMSLAAAQQVYTCREAAARFFGLHDPTGVIFMPNCTAAINTVLFGILHDGGRVLISDLEHNAVLRPCYALSPGRPRFDVAAWSPNEEETIENFRCCITPQTRLIFCTHASNVFGVTLPIRRLAKLAHEHGILFGVDAAQTAGVLPLNMEEDGIDFLCVAAHKGLYAPVGSGMLLCNRQETIKPLLYGGTGSHSKLAVQPDELPDRLESGTLNTAGICGTLAGIRFVEHVGCDAIYAHEIRILQRVYDALHSVPGITLYAPRAEIGRSAPTLSLNVDGYTSEQTAAQLDRAGVCVRAGLHCAPLAHRRFGTLEGGAVRLAPSVFTKDDDVEKLCKLFRQLAEKALHRRENMV